MSMLAAHADCCKADVQIMGGAGWDCRSMSMAMAGMTSIQAHRHSQSVCEEAVTSTWEAAAASMHIAIARV